MEYTEGDQCSKMVSDSGPWGAFHQHRCNKKAVVEIESKPYCKIHDPEYIEAKSQGRTRKYKENSCHNCGVHRGNRVYRHCPWCGEKY